MIEIHKGDYKNLIKTIKDKSIDLVLTDPPYWHKKSPGKPYSQRKAYNTISKFANSDLFHAENKMMKEMSDFTGDDVDYLMNQIKRVMKKMNAYIFCNDTLLPYYGMWAERNNYHFSVLVWEKPLSIINKNRFSQHIEYIVRIYDYGTALNKVENENHLYSKVKRYTQVRGKNKLHPTQKPTELLKEILKLNCNKNDLVLDLFAGSFSTGDACFDLDINCIGFEIDEYLFDVSKKRIESKIKEKELESNTLFPMDM